MPKQGQDTVADQIRGCLHATDPRDDGIGDYFVLGQAIAIHFGGKHRLYKAFARLQSHLTNRLAEIRSHLLDGSEHQLRMLGVVLEIAQHLGEVGGPFF